MTITNKTPKPIRVDGHYLKPDESVKITNRTMVRLIQVDAFNGDACEVLIEFDQFKSFSYGNLNATEVSDKDTRFEEKMIEIKTI